MTNDKFQNAEREFFKLKGQFAAGRITHEQFDAALKELIVEDAQGRYWMLGVDTGKWYVHDGAAWIEGTPPGVSATPPQTLTTAPPPLSPSPSPKSVSQRPNRWLALIGTALGGLLTILVGLSVTFGQNALRSAFLGNTVIPTPTIASAFAFTPLPSLTAPPISATTTLVQTPTPTLIVLLQPSPVSTQLATPLPTKPTEMATSTSTFTPTALPATLTPPLPPGLYVTSLRLDPPAPRRGQVIVFYPTFLNSATGDQNPRWLVYIYHQDNLKISLGETTPLGTTIPPGSSEQKSLTWKVTGLNNCENYLARVAWLDTFKKATPFNKPDGSIFEAPFSVCP